MGDLAKWRWGFGFALMTHDWEKLNTLISLIENEEQLLNNALCYSATGLWYSRTDKQIDALLNVIGETIEKGATDIEDALNDSLATIICLSTHLCNQGIYNDVTVTTLFDTLNETEKWAQQHYEDCPEHSIFKMNVKAAGYMKSLIGGGIDIFVLTHEADGGIDIFHEPVDVEIENLEIENGYNMVQKPTYPQLVGFTKFVAIAVNYLPATVLTKSFYRMIHLLSIFSDSLDPGWASAIQRTGLPHVLDLMAHRMTEHGGARIINKEFTEASKSGHSELVDIMLQVVDPVIPLNSHVALIFACIGDQPETVERLLDHGVTTFGNEPLKEAASRGHLEIVQMLISKGCRLEEVHEALEVAMGSSQLEVVDCICFYLLSGTQ